MLLEDGGPRLIGTVRAFDPVFYEQVAVDKPEENILGIRAKLRWIGKEVTGIYFDRTLRIPSEKVFLGLSRFDLRGCSVRHATIVVLLAIIASPAVAKTYICFGTGNRLNNPCLSTSPDNDDGICFGYALGVADSLSRGSALCYPPQIGASQVVDVAKRYLRDHPELRHVCADELFARALLDAFPCPAPPQRS